MKSIVQSTSCDLRSRDCAYLREGNIDLENDTPTLIHLFYSSLDIRILVHFDVPLFTDLRALRPSLRDALFLFIPLLSTPPQ